MVQHIRNLAGGEAFLDYNKFLSAFLVKVLNLHATFRSAVTDKLIRLFELSSTSNFQSLLEF